MIVPVVADTPARTIRDTPETVHVSGKMLNQWSGAVKLAKDIDHDLTLVTRLVS